MNVVDIFILIILAFGALIGFKRGFTKSLVSCIGFTLVVVLAFLLKNPISVFFYEHLPFFSFGGILKGVTVLNIVLYEVLAFLVVFMILLVLLRVLLLATSIFEKILNMTIILGIPSKILGAIVGLVQYFVITFVVLYVLSLPIFHLDIIKQSSMAPKILNSTPLLSNMVEKSVHVVEEFATIKDKYQSVANAGQFNYETLDLLLKYDVVDVKSIEKLKQQGKISMDNIDQLLNKYRKE